MALARHQFTVVDEAGDIQATSSIEVRRESDNGLASLFSDRLGASAIGNPFNTDAEGFAAFHVVGGAYKIVATKGAFSRTYRYVGVGTSSEADVSSFAVTLFDDADAAAARVTLGVSTTTKNVMDYITPSLWAGIEAGTNTTDLASFIATANSAVGDAQTLRFPGGRFRVLGSGSAAIILGAGGESIHWEGEGFGTWIEVVTGFPNTRDIIQVAPTIGTRNYSIEKMRIGGGASALGRHAIHFNYVGSDDSSYFTNIDKCLVDPTETGYSIKTTNAAGIALGGGLFYSNIYKCSLDSINMERVGDGNNIDACTIDGLSGRTAIEVSQVSGAANLRIINNTLTGAAGQIIINGAVAARIIANWCEQNVNSTQANGAQIDIQGDVAAALHPIIEQNTLAVNAGVTGVTGQIRLDTCTRAVVDNNYLSQRGSGKHIVTTANCVEAYIGNKQHWIVDDAIALPQITDAGVRTISPYRKQFVPAAGRAKLGGSGAGWAIDADTARPQVTLPASQTNEVLLVPVEGLQTNDTVISVGVVGQIESGGNTVTATLDVRKQTAAAADISDASLGTDTLGAGVTTDTILSVANLGVTGLTEVIADDEQIYATLTATTGVSCDIDIMGLSVTVLRR